MRGANQLLEEYAVESELDLEVQAYTLAEAEAMLQIIQQLDPPGVGRATCANACCCNSRTPSSRTR